MRVSNVNERGQHNDDEGETESSRKDRNRRSRGAGEGEQGRAVGDRLEKLTCLRFYSPPWRVALGYSDYWLILLFFIAKRNLVSCWTLRLLAVRSSHCDQCGTLVTCKISYSM